MSLLTEGKKLGDFLAFETDARYCRETFLAEGTIEIGRTLKNGTDAATQKAPTVAAGTGANAIALHAAEDGEPVVCLVRGPAVVVRGQLAYHADATANQKDAADALLEAEGILVRDGEAHA